MPPCTKVLTYSIVPLTAIGPMHDEVKFNSIFGSWGSKVYAT